MRQDDGTAKTKGCKCKISFLGETWKAGFEKNLKEKPCSKWFIRIFNGLILLMGLACVAMSGFAMSQNLPLGSWPKAGVVLGLSLMISGGVGIGTTFKSCAFLALLYFMGMLMLTVLVLWAGVYAFTNKATLESDVQVALSKNWQKWSTSLPDAVVQKFKDKGLSCVGEETMSNECWLEIKAFITDDWIIAGSCAMVIEVLLLALLVCSGHMLGARNVISAVIGIMDTIVLGVGVAVCAVGVYLLTSVPGASTTAFVFLGLGVVLVFLSTLFGAFCDGCYKKCCTCSGHWAVATIAYSILFVVFLAAGITALTHEDTVAAWVSENYSSICNQDCRTAMSTHVAKALVNSTCTPEQMQANSKVSGGYDPSYAAITSGAPVKPAAMCVDMLPAECYTKALDACDLGTASMAAVAVALLSNMQNGAWLMLLAAMFLLIQVCCKAYKWKTEGKEKESITGGADTGYGSNGYTGAAPQSA